MLVARYAISYCVGRKRFGQTEINVIAEGKESYVRKVVKREV